jgi:hypothetical protein
MENVTTIQTLSHEEQITKTSAEIESLRRELANSKSDQMRLNEEISELRRFPCSFGCIPSDSTEFMVLTQVDGVLQTIAVSSDPAKNPNRSISNACGLELVAPNPSDTRQHFQIDSDPERNVIHPACEKGLTWDWGCGQVYCDPTHKRSNQRFMYDGSHFICKSNFEFISVTNERILVVSKPINVPNRFIVAVRGSPLWRDLENQHSA